LCRPRRQRSGTREFFDKEAPASCRARAPNKSMLGRTPTGASRRPSPDPGAMGMFRWVHYR
jgi:hypothetical protein